MCFHSDEQAYVNSFTVSIGETALCAINKGLIASTLSVLPK